MNSDDRGRKGGGEKRLRLSEDLLWGIHPVFESLEKTPDNISELIVQKDKRGDKIEKIVDTARSHGIKVTFCEVLRLTGEGSGQARHQGVAVRLCGAPLADLDGLLEEWAARIRNGERLRVVVCDSLQDPHNLGAIIRSALAAGAVAVIVTRERSAPLGGTAAKASAGAMAHLPICQVTNLVTTLQSLKKIGFWVFGAVKESGVTSLYDSDLTVPCCLVVGSEGKGLRPLVRRECDMLLSIPMTTSLDSLNSSVAAAVILFEALRQNLFAGSRQEETSVTI
jgi:23S rRNA (guanosine2251-2'-O)-methyltransferase